MKIIDKPDYTTWKYEFTCLTCASKLCADHTDLKFRITEQWYSGRDFDEGYYAKVDYYFIVCSVCNKERQIIPNAMGVNLPYLLQEKVKKEYKEYNESIKKNKY